MREPLSSKRIIDAALALADASGIDRLTMRALAAELGVEAMSLYNLVRNKEELLAMEMMLRIPSMGLSQALYGE